MNSPKPVLPSSFCICWKAPKNTNAPVQVNAYSGIADRKAQPAAACLRPGSAADYPRAGEAGLPALAARTGHQVAQLLGLAKVLPLRSVGAAQRPMTSDDRPLCGYVEGIDGLFALVAHPGVILAPFLGRRCAQSVLGA